MREKEEMADFIKSFLGLEAMPDLRKAVDLSRDEYMGIGMVVLMEMMVELNDRQVRNPSAKQPEKVMDALSESTRKCVREDMTRLEKGVQNPDKHKAAEAAEVLGWLQFVFLQVYSAAEKSARRSIELDPEREAAWDILFLSLPEAKMDRKVVAICRQRLEHKDSVRNRLFLAKAYASLDQLEKAEAAIQVGLNHEPDDFMLRLAQADLLLMRGDEGSVNQAGILLNKMRKEKLSDIGWQENRWCNYTFTCGVYFGLIDDSETAHKWLEKLQQGQPEYPGLQEALKALDECGEAVTPPPSP
jgi:tetratricopeptide (TPR) repeat protein